MILPFGFICGVAGYLLWLYLKEMREHDRTKAQLWKVTDRYHQARKDRDRLLDRDEADGQG